MTYREKIQSMIEEITKLYDDAEWLRDMAFGGEKEYWNAHRKIFYDAAEPLRKLDNSLSKLRAGMCLCDNNKTDHITKNCSKCGQKNTYKKFTCNDCKGTWTRNNYCENCSEVLEA